MAGMLPRTGRPPAPSSRRVMAELTDSSDGVPSGSSAGMSTALCSAKTPGDGSGVGRPLAIRRLASSRWVSLGPVRSR